MNKTIKTLIIIFSTIIGIGIICTGIYFVLNTKDYWKTQMEIQNEQLQLRKPECVDSLINVINIQDSLIQINNHVYDSIKHRCDSVVEYYKEDNKRLLNVIEHQNQMISNLTKK